MLVAERSHLWTLKKEEGRQRAYAKGRKGLDAEAYAEAFAEGYVEGWLEAMKMVQEILLFGISERFGSVPEEVRLRVEVTTDLEELKHLLKRLLTASSLADLGL